MENLIAEKLRKYNHQIHSTGYGYYVKIRGEGQDKIKKIANRLSKIENVLQVKSIPGDKISRIMLCNINLEQFLPEEALEKYCSSTLATVTGLLQAMKKRPFDEFLGKRLSKLLTECGQTLLSKKTVEAASKCFTMSTLYDDDDAQAHLSLGNIYKTSELVDLEKAEFHYIRLIELRPSNAITYLRLGEVLLNNSKAALAVRFLKKYVTINPRDVRGHSLFGLAKLKLGAFEHAKDHLLHALRLDNDHKGTYIPLAQTYEALGNYDRARVILKNYMQREKRDFRLYEMMGRFYSMSSEYKKAKRYLKRCLKINPDNIEVYRQLADVYMELGESDKYRVMMRKHDEWNRILEQYGGLKALPREENPPRDEEEESSEDDTTILEIEDMPEIEDLQ